MTKELSASFEIARPEQPPEVSNLAALGRLPSALGACLGAIAVAALSHLLLVTSRRRARELTILRVLGFTPRQAGSSILVMAVTTAVVGAGTGLVLGVAAGRLVWNVVVDALSIEAPPARPVAFLVSLALAAPIVSMLIAAPPARRASAVRPAVVLREE